MCGGGGWGDGAGGGSGGAFANGRSGGSGGLAGTRWGGRVTALQLGRKLCGLRAEERAAVVDAEIRDYALLQRNWDFWARPEQLAPDGNWRTWLIVAGRGFGKNGTGAEWVRAGAEARGDPGVSLGGAIGRSAGRGRGGDAVEK